jgi:hypothetical protein
MPAYFLDQPPRENPDTSSRIRAPDPFLINRRVSASENHPDCVGTISEMLLHIAGRYAVTGPAGSPGTGAGTSTSRWDRHP